MGSSVDIDGVTGSGIVYSDLTDMDSASQCTIAGWIYFDTTGAGHYLIGKGMPSFITTSYMMFLDNGPKLQLIVRNPSGQWDGNLGDTNFFTTYSTGEWLFVAATWDYNGGSRVIKLYVNGAEDPSSSRNTDNISTLGNDTGSFGIGDGPASNFALDGKISYVHVYDRALSIEEIQEIQEKPGSIAQNLVYFLPLIDAAYTDWQGNAGSTSSTTGVSSSSLGPPVFFPELL